MSVDLKTAYGLSGKTALVTGGGSGLGLAIAKCLSAAGARIIIAGRREPILSQACQDIGQETAYEVIDLADVKGVRQAADKMVDTHGPIDILINNAGNTIKKPFQESSIEDFDQVFDVHVRGALELTRRLVGDQISCGEGSVIFTSSMTAYIGQPNVLGYTVAKTALSGVIRGLAAELSSQGVRE
ncbi:MAG: SDR family oxidoreductase [Pseudomonadota bacterium]